MHHAIHPLRTLTSTGLTLLGLRFFPYLLTNILQMIFFLQEEKSLRRLDHYLFQALQLFPLYTLGPRQLFFQRK